MIRCFTPILLLACFSLAHAGDAAGSGKLAETENIYLDASDARTVIASMDAGLFQSYEGKDRKAWADIYRATRKELSSCLPQIPAKGLSDGDRHALASMRAQLESFPANIETTPSPRRHCADAQRSDRAMTYSGLRAALVACFAENDQSMMFEESQLNRSAALDLLSEVEAPERRKALFMGFGWLWRQVNGNDEPNSPYRRLIAMAAADGGSEVDRAARDIGKSTSDVEHWLEQILDAWREASGDQPVEPWDFSFQGTAADRMLASFIPLASLRSINQRFYADLGLDLEHSGIVYDLEARGGRTPVSETEFITHGRMVDGTWHPAAIRVSAAYAQGGLPVLNELVHENGHVANLTAIRNRPAFSDWPSDLFSEAFADVPAWSIYEPAWQRKYLGHEAPETISLRALYTGVVMDVAWSLFELRMAGNPSADPNALWTEITHHYLHIVPHPELSWWALRVQLVDSPGYMVNYGLGAVLTAEMREKIRETMGPFDAGDSRWHDWLGQDLLRYGSERDTYTLMKDFLGRAVSPDALMVQIKRLRFERSK